MNKTTQLHYLRQIALCILLLFYSNGFAAMKLETIGKAYWYEMNPEDDFLGYWAGCYDNYLLLEKSFGKIGTFVFENDLDGSLRYGGMPEQTMPFDNYLGAGIRIQTEKLYFHSLLSNDLYLFSKELMPSFYPSGFKMIPRALSAATIKVAATPGKIKFNGEFTYFRLNYDYLTTTASSLNPAVDDDLLSDVDLRFQPRDQFYLLLGTNLKNDFNGYNGYEYGDHRVEVGGSSNIKLGSMRVYTDWLMSLHYIISETLYNRGENEEGVGSLYFRTLLRLKSRLYARGTLRTHTDFNQGTTLYGDISIRKSWSNMSAIELLYWSTGGGAFPRQGTSLTSSAVFGPLTISPAVKLYFNYDDQGSSTFYKTVTSIETSIKLKKRAEIVAGFDYTYYVMNQPPFTMRSLWYAGVRRW